ncbi:ankyrin repeat protein [Colletotrichum incanum]|nr:ankyrin repeat protein [Colletotrichum incanum]
MAQDIKSTGLGSLEDIYLSIIPALSKQRKLPEADVVVDLARKHAKRHEQLLRWNEAGDIYFWLFRTAMTFPGESSIVAKATAVVVEYVRQVAAVIELGEIKLEGIYQLGQLRNLKSTFEKELQSTFKEQPPLAPGEKLQSADQKTLSSLSRLFVAGSNGLDVPVEYQSYPPVFNLTELHQVEYFDKIPSFEMRAEIRRAIERGANVDGKDVRGWTPLHYAAAKGLKRMANALLEFDADVNARNLLEWTPLHYACRHNDTQLVQSLLREGGEVNAQGRDGVAPLHCAAMEGLRDVVSFLIEAGATIDILDTSGNTPLLWAAFRGHEDVVSYLWKDASKRLRDKNGRTALHLAVLGGHKEVVIWVALEMETDKNARERHGRTPLHLASTSGYESIVKLLAGELSCDKDTKDDSGWTPLHHALLVEAGADMEAKDNEGYTPLHWAVIEEHESIVKLLVEAGADMEAKDNDGNTPLDVARSYQRDAVANLFIQT